MIKVTVKQNGHKVGFLVDEAGNKPFIEQMQLKCQQALKYLHLKSNLLKR